MSKLKIGYENLLDNTSTYSFTTGTEDGNNPFANAYDNHLYDYMNLAASASAYQIDSTLDATYSADYFAFYKTNLAAAGGTIKLQRYNGASYEDVFTNLLTYSEDITQSDWTKTNVAVDTATTKFTPDSRGYAPILNATGAGGSLRQTEDVTSGDTYYFKGWVAFGGATSIRVRLSNGGDLFLSFNSTGTELSFSSQTSVDSYTITKVGNGWFYVEMVSTASSTATATVRLYPDNLGTAGTYFWGWMLSDINNSYVRTEGTSGAYAPADTTPVFVSFPTASASQWRLEIDNNNTAVTIADIKFGEQISTEFGQYIGFSTPILSREIEYTNNTSDRGLPLGRSIVKKGFNTVLDVEFMTDTFARETWLPFVKHAEKNPFYLAWNFTDYNSEIAYCVTDGAIGKGTQSNYGRMATNMSVTGFTE